MIPTRALLDSLYRPSVSAPNGAIMLATGRDDADVVAVKLSNPRYNAKRATLRYDARRLRRTSRGLRHLDDRLDRSLPRRFGAVSLFIDDATSFGNSCTAAMANSTDGTMVAISASNWPTDTWDHNPYGAGIPNDGKFYNGGDDHGGFLRGCSFDVTWEMPDGSALVTHTQDPESGPNEFTCTPSDPARYTCSLDPSSIIHGPALFAYWTVTVNQ